MPDRTRGFAPVATSEAVSSGEVVALGMGRIVSGSAAGRRRAPEHPWPAQEKPVAGGAARWQGARMETAPTLTDGAVLLRGHREDDVAGVFEQCQDAASRRWTTVPVPYSVEDAREFVTRQLPNGWADGSSWGFAVEVDGRFAGTVELRDEGDGRLEVAYG